MHNQENRPPAATTQEAPPFGSPKPLPVKNTFIHYGTPIRHTTGVRGTPKTVPPDFAPEARLLEPLQIPFPGAAVESQPSPIPNTGGRPGPDAWRAGAEQPVQLARGRGVAPLRLFDFLPSPSTAPAQGSSASVLQLAPRAAAVTNFMAQPAAPSTAVGVGCQAQVPGSVPVFWQHMEPPVQSSMAPPPTNAPMSYGVDLQSYLQPSGVQQHSWPAAWNSGVQQTTVQLPAATAHCLGAMNNPALTSAASVQGMTMPAASSSMTAMANQQHPTFTAAPLQLQHPW